MRLDIERLRTLDEVRDFMAGSSPVDFRFVERADAYGFVRRVLVRVRYVRLPRSDKGLVRQFLVKVTRFSRAQVSRLISQYRETGRIEDRRRGPKRPFPQRYTKADIGLLAEVDETLGGLCGAVTRRLMQRQYEVFGDARFERLAGLSNSHLYRLRRSVTYRRRRLTVAKTRSPQVRTGERRKPHPAGRPGFLRVDSVHQGGLDGEKGLYEINLVDEVTQYEFVAAVEGISDAFHGSGPSRVDRGFPLHRPRLPRRQRLRVRQPSGGGVAQQAARCGVHQVPPEALQRQRPGREQERLGGPGCARTGPDPPSVVGTLQGTEVLILASWVPPPPRMKCPRKRGKFNETD